MEINFNKIIVSDVILFILGIIGVYTSMIDLGIFILISIIIIYNLFHASNLYTYYTNGFKQLYDMIEKIENESIDADVDNFMIIHRKIKSMYIAIKQYQEELSKK